MGLSSTLNLARLTITKLATAKAAALTVAVVAGGGTGLASVGALPDPAQRAAAHVLEHVGIDVPTPLDPNHRPEDNTSTTVDQATSDDPPAHDANDANETPSSTVPDTPGVEDHHGGTTDSADRHGHGNDGQHDTSSTTEPQDRQAGRDSSSGGHDGDSNQSTTGDQQSAETTTTTPGSTTVPENHSGRGGSGGSGGSDSSSSSSGGSSDSGNSSSGGH